MSFPPVHLTELPTITILVRGQNRYERSVANMNAWVLVHTVNRLRLDSGHGARSKQCGQATHFLFPLLRFYLRKRFNWKHITRKKYQRFATKNFIQHYMQHRLSVHCRLELHIKKLYFPLFHNYLKSLFWMYV